MSDKIEVTKEDTKAEVAPAVEEKAEIRKGVNPKTFHYELLPPNDPRVRVPVAPFKDHMLEEYGIKEDDLEWKIKEVRECVNKLESAIYDLVEPFEDKKRDIDNEKDEAEWDLEELLAENI